jgi:hypothetical protein
MSTSPCTTDSTTNLLTKIACMPQVDGCIDDNDNDNDNTHASLTVIHDLIEQILMKTSSEPEHVDRNDSMNQFDPIYSSSTCTTNVQSSSSKTQIFDTQKTNSISNNDLIRLYQQWSKSVVGRVKFTITNDEGYRLVTDDLDAAWSTIIDLIRTCRDDMNLKHLPMSHEGFNGHQIFGLTKPIIQVMLNQIFTNSSAVKQPTASTGSIVLPLSSSSSSHMSSTSTSHTDMINKKHSLSSSSRTNIYERKFRERQRFGWLLNHSRKIDYALKSFEIDDALVHAR